MTVRIGNGCGFWGDRIDASYELVSRTPQLDYLTLDYLAEMSLSIMAVQQEKNPNLGYAQDFIEVIQTLIPLWKSGRKFKVVTNAGGLNPKQCSLEVKRALGDFHLKIGIVSGDDVRFAFPKCATANAYLGANPLVDALNEGADIVITGRVADPSLTVACAMYHFGWSDTDYDKLAQATVAGHLIECGTQVTGGLMDNWLNQPQLENIGYPYVEMEQMGSFTLRKPEGTGGEISIRTVKEQLVYEIQNPAAYLSPDVTVNFLDIGISETLTLSGAKGSPPTSTYKVSGSEKWGWYATSEIGLVGDRLIEKSEKIQSIIAERLGHQVEITSSLIGINGLCPTFPSTSFEALLRLSAKSRDKEAIVAFTKELAPFITCGPMGTCAYTGGRSQVRPLFIYKPGLIEKTKVKPLVEYL